MCHELLQDPNFFRLLLCIDQELAGELKAGGCVCGGVLHRADYPRKPRGCLAEVRSQFESRWSFCCNRCRKRSTSMSVRFLGRRVYLAVAVERMPGSALERFAGTRAQSMRHFLMFLTPLTAARSITMQEAR